jgi:hypothetical protein
MGILIMQPIREGDRPIEYQILIAVAIQPMDRLAWLPALRLLGLILREAEAVNRLEGPIDLSAP